MTDTKHQTRVWYLFQRSTQGCGNHNALEGIVGGTLPNLYDDMGSDIKVCIVVANTELASQVCEFGVGNGTATSFPLLYMPTKTPTVYVNGAIANPQPTVKSGAATFAVAPALGAVIQEQE